MEMEEFYIFPVSILIYDIAHYLLALAVDIFILSKIVYSGIYRMVEQLWTDSHLLRAILKKL